MANNYIRTPDLSKFSWQNPVLGFLDENFSLEDYTPQVGERYIFLEYPTGNDEKNIFPEGLTKNSIIYFSDNQWFEDIPKDGWQTFDVSSKMVKLFVDGEWQNNKAEGTGGDSKVEEEITGGNSGDISDDDPNAEEKKNTFTIDPNSPSNYYNINTTTEQFNIVLPSIDDLKEDKLITFVKTQDVKKLVVKSPNGVDYLIEDGNSFVFCEDENKNNGTSLIQLRANKKTKIWMLENGIGVWVMEID